MGSETSKPTKTLAVNGNTSPGLRRGSSGDASESAIITTTVTNKSNGSTGAINGNGTIRNAIGLPPAIKVGASISYNENLLSAGIPQQTDSKLTIDNSRSRSGSASSQTSKQRRTIVTLKNRQLIQGCFQNPHENLGRRILKRTAERRRDFGRFYVSLSAEQKDDIEETIKTWLKKCVANIEFMDEVQRLAEEFGERFVNFRTLSFKADYFASMADATVAECVLLDNAVHPAHQTLTAFSQFFTMLFSSVRDGFYTEMRRNRRTSNSFSTGSNGSARRQKPNVDEPTSREASPRSASPESTHNSATGSGSCDSLHIPAQDATTDGSERPSEADITSYENAAAAPPSTVPPLVPCSQDESHSPTPNATTMEEENVTRAEVQKQLSDEKTDEAGHITPSEPLN
ncbi:GLoBin related [Ditylenchus destructor]|nr:GLoBin related [Ditylenchus destructor]